MKQFMGVRYEDVLDPRTEVLVRELLGYDEYRRRVRYRLVLFVW